MKGRFTVFNRVGLGEKVTCEGSLKEVRRAYLGGRAFQVEGTASVKTLRLECKKITVKIRKEQ